MMIVARSQHPQKLAAITMMVLVGVVPVTTLATKAKEIATATLTVSVI